jgi:hypothetical protein
MRCNTPYLIPVAAPLRRRTRTKPPAAAPAPASPARKKFNGCTTHRRDFDLLKDLTGIDWRPDFVCELTIQQALVEGLAHAVSHRDSLRRLIVCVGGKIIAAYRVSVAEVISRLAASSQTGAIRSYRFGRFFPIDQGIVTFLRIEIKSACCAALRDRFRHGFFSGTMRVVERGKVKMKTCKHTHLPLRKTHDADSYEIDYDHVRADCLPDIACAYAALSESSDPFFQTV